ncbi:MAG: ABC transporter permease subunit [Patescibacteria group bacterium]|jgi:ABC-2 type transport system permease protein
MNALFGKEILEIIRTKKLLILVILFLFIAFASPALAKITPELLKNIPQTPGLSIQLPEPTWRDSIDQFVKNISQIALLVLVFVFAGIIAEEKNKKTLEVVLTKPVSRAKFVLSKFFAAYSVLAVIYIASSLIFYAYTIVIFGSFSFALFSLLASIFFVYLLFITATTILCSAFTSNQIVAAFISFGIQIVITIILSLIKEIKKILPGNIMTNYKDIFTGLSPHDYLPSLITTIAIIILFMIISIFIFKRQEIER